MHNLDQRKCNVEDLKLLQAKTAKLAKEMSHMKHQQERTKDRMRVIESNVAAASESSK